MKHCKTSVKSLVDCENRVLKRVSEHSKDLKRNNFDKRVPWNEKKQNESFEKYKSHIAKTIRYYPQKTLLWRSTEVQNDVMSMILRNMH